MCDSKSALGTELHLSVCEQVLPLRYTFMPTNYFQDPQRRPLPPPVIAAYEAVKAQLGLKELLPFPVDHVAYSTGCKLVGEAGWKLVFSGRAGWGLGLMKPGLCL